MDARSIQKINAHLEAAKAYSKLSYARRLKVGAVIVRDDRVISIGYNGTPSGRDNNCEVINWPELNSIYSLKKIKDSDEKQMLSLGAELITKEEVCHAEANAILFAAKIGVSTGNSTLITTHSPCFECSKMIIQSGISEVYYENVYRDEEPLMLLSECNVLIKKIGDLND